MHLFTTLRTNFKKSALTKLISIRAVSYSMAFAYRKAVLDPFRLVVVGAQEKEEVKIEYLFLFACITTSSFFHTWFKSNYFNCQMELSTKHELEEKSHI